MKKFDVSQPRWRYWVKKAKEGMRCPRCGSELESEQHAYLVLIKQASEIESLICGVNGGYFCNNCPSIVLDRERFESIIRYNTNGRNFSYMVPGIINRDEIPKENRDVELGADDNPIPIVEFKEPNQKNISRTRASKRKNSKRRKRK